MSNLIPSSVTRPIGQMRDYQHAKKIFVDSQYRLSPKYGFLFYVEFDFNPLITNLSNKTAQEMGMVVKSVNLPSFSIDIKAHNAYNRKNYVQNAIKYDPVTITFHDDQSDNVLSFWYDYYSYYFRDSDYADATYGALHKYQSRATFDWGYSPRPAIGYNGSNSAQPYQYIQAIRLYSLYQGNFDEYELINPIITNFKHGELANGANDNVLQHEMAVQFETVKYLTGRVTPTTVGGYIDLLYDNVPSPLLQGNQQPSSVTSSDRMTDFANKTTTLGYQINQALFTTANPASMSIADALNKQTDTNAKTSTNSGGFVLPGIGSFKEGVPNPLSIAQSIEARGVSAVSKTTGSFANGLSGSGTAGLGAVVGLAAQALANPAATLQTIQNMGTSTALGLAVSTVGGVINAGQQGLSSILGTATPPPSGG